MNNTSTLLAQSNSQSQNTINTVIEYQPPKKETSPALKTGLSALIVVLAIAFVAVAAKVLIDKKKTKHLTPSSPTQV